MNSETKIIVSIAAVCVAILAIGGWLYSGSIPSNIEEGAISHPELLAHNDSRAIPASKEEKIKLVEFGDYQCPACGGAYPMIKTLLETYGDRVTFVFRNYPLNIHPNALPAAKAAEAAGMQGKYFEMHDMLYEHQNEWSELVDAKPTFEKYAQLLNLDVEKFKKDSDNASIVDKIKADMSDGDILGVISTPTFFVGESTVRVADFKTIKDAIEKELAKKEGGTTNATTSSSSSSTSVPVTVDTSASSAAY